MSNFLAILIWAVVNAVTLIGFIMFNYTLLGG